MDDRIRVLIVDDHFVVRRGVCALLGGVDDIIVVGEAGDGLQALHEVERCDPQVVLMDLKLPRLDGVEATRRILATRPDVAVVVLTGTDAEGDVLAAIRAGALGYLAKTAPRDDFLSAIRQVSRGATWLPARLARTLLAHVQSPAAAGDALTRRETEVLALLARGWSNRGIAEHLCISEVTVRTHVSHLLDKLGARNRVEAVLQALRLGLATAESA